MPTERPSTVAAKRDAHGSQAARSLSEAMRLPRPISLFSVVQARIKVDSPVSPRQQRRYSIGSMGLIGGLACC